MDVAKVFTTGRSQAIRIPKRFRVSSSVVSIRREGDSLIITPPSSLSWDQFFAECICPDFTLDRSDMQVPQHREMFE